MDVNRYIGRLDFYAIIAVIIDVDPLGESKLRKLLLGDVIVYDQVLTK